LDSPVRARKSMGDGTFASGSKSNHQR
jgi:hypothetical protein